MTEAQSGDEAAIRELLDRHRTVVTATLAACGVRTRDTAFDLAQEVAIRVWQRLPELRTPEAVTGWIRRIAANAARDHLRRRLARPEGPLEEVPEPVAASDPHDLLERQEEVRMMISALGDEEDEIVDLLLAAVHGASSEVLAERAGTTVAALKMKLSRARKRLRRRLEGLRSG